MIQEKVLSWSQMAFLVVLAVTRLISTTESTPCVQKEFTETPIDVHFSCSPKNIENRWRGELSYTLKDTHIEVHWKKIVQNGECVKDMKFFVDGVEERDIWGIYNENVRIDKIGKFSFKVKVYYIIPGTSGDCFGRQCKCFEATKILNVHGDDGSNIDNNQEDSTDSGSIVDNNQEDSTDDNPCIDVIPLVAGSFAGGNFCSQS